MNLNALMVQSFFEHHALDVGLQHKGTELSGPGYRRCKVTDWKTVDGEARGTGVWGPFQGGARWDSIGLYHEGRLVDVIPCEETSIPSATVWTQSVVVAG